MSEGIGFLAKALEAIERWMGRQDQAKVRKEQNRTVALEALLAAIAETTAYTADRRGGVLRNRKREAKIAQLWSRASVCVYTLDRRLSTVLAMQSMGWADPELWDTPAFKNAPLELGRIRDQCLWLLGQDT